MIKEQAIEVYTFTSSLLEGKVKEIIDISGGFSVECPNETDISVKSIYLDFKGFIAIRQNVVSQRFASFNDHYFSISHREEVLWFAGAIVRG